MYVQIGVPKEPSDIVDLLLECHERIRTFVGLAGRLANTRQPSVDEVRCNRVRASCPPHLSFTPDILTQSARCPPGDVVIRG